MSGERREFYAGSVQEAIEKAAVTMGVPLDQLEYEVLDSGSSGFLGIGTRDARILVTLHNSTIASAPDINTPPPSSEIDAVAGLQEDTLPLEDAPVNDESSIDHPAEGVDQLIEEAPEDLILRIDGLATELLGKMGFDATVDAYDSGEVLKVDVKTSETGLLVGQKGETIDAIQYFMNVAVSKEQSFLKRIVVDTEGYRQRRVEALQGMAHRTARRAQRENRSLNLPPMNAAERRVVHMYLKDNPNVSTSSEGNEAKRRVVVTPIK